MSPTAATRQTYRTRYQQLDEPEGLPRASKESHDPRLIGGWKIGRTIGKGSSGRVRIARHAKTGQYAAIKIVSKTSLLNSRISLVDLEEEADRILLGIEREIVIMKLIDHPNIMHLYDVWETSGELYLVLEYVEGGELFDYICEKGRLPVYEALKYFQQIISAVDYCHRFNIAHRDLKPENLLLDSNKNIKVADFGMAAWQNTSSGALLETSCGSPHYAAPEVVMGKRYDGFSSDIWSCGVVLYALLMGRLPFDDEEGDTIRLLEKVKLGKFFMPTDIPVGAQDLLRRMLEKNVSKRISMPEILSHPWFTSQPLLHSYTPPPPLGDIAKPVASASEIDYDIFGNMRVLWQGTSDEDIIKGLTNDKQTWEKAVYHLLLKYRAKHLENYAGDKKIKPRKAKRSSKPPTEGHDRKPTGVSPKPSRSWRASTPPPRPDPPTPRRASTQQEEKRSRDCPSPSPLRQIVTLNMSSSGPRLPPLSERSSAISDPCSPTSPTSPIWDALQMTPIQSPLLNDPKIQNFFQQIVDQLDIMQLNKPVQSTIKATKSDHGTDIQLQSTRSVQTYNDTSSPPIPSNLEVDKADDFLLVDIDDYGVTFSMNSPHKTGSNAPRLSSGVSVGLGISSIQKKPRESSSSESSPESPSSTGSNSTDEPGSAKSRFRAGILRKQSVKKSSDEKKKIKFADNLVMEKHPKSRTADGSDTLFSPVSDDAFILPGLSLPKRSWFNHLFKFNPASYQLLSTQDLENTQDECRRLLAGYSVQSILIQSGTLGVLKCKLSEIRDPAGVMAVIKAVRFRVEFIAATPPQIEGGYAVSLKFIQEKGALSTFKLIFNRLRSEWVLDGVKSPFILPSPAFTNDNILEEVGNAVVS